MSNCRKIKTDESGNPLQITINNSTTNIKATENSEIITIDDSFEELKMIRFLKKEVSKENQLNDSLFIVDTLPKIQDTLDIPMYGKKFNKVSKKRKMQKIPT